MQLSAEQALARLQFLRIAFGAKEAVHGISFTRCCGEVLGLVGESGSGKSATSLAMMRLLPPSAHVTGSIQGVAAVYQRAEFLAERKAALEAWANIVVRAAEGGPEESNVVTLPARAG